MPADYPVQVEVSSPAHFDRLQLLVRLVLAIALAVVGITAGWLVFLLYLMLPVIAAIAISTSSGDRYTREFAPRLWRVLHWLLQFSAYMALLVDRFPTGDHDAVHVYVRVGGTPTVGSALGRLATSVPSSLVLLVLWLVASLLLVVAAVLVLVGATVPPTVLGFQRGVLRWQARLVAYHASLIAAYPPFSFDTDDGHPTPMASAAT